ncbi:MAG TPA: MFS transporter, partial [Nannocystis exedens]|nr:MFS transporter [Nannocystis exedens]
MLRSGAFWHCSVAGFAGSGSMRAVTWAELARRRDFRRLWLGDAVSLLGDWFTYVAVGMLALEGGGGLTAVALVLVAHTLPRAIFSPLAGRLADRYDRRRIMVVVSLLRGVVVVGMALAAVADWLFTVQALLFVRMALGALFDPAAQASLPQLVPRRLLGRANALLGATWSVVFAVGVGLGGLVTAGVGVALAMVIDALTFGIAAAVLSTLPRLLPGDQWSEQSDPRGGGAGVLSATGTGELEGASESSAMDEEPSESSAWTAAGVAEQGTGEAWLDHEDAKEAKDAGRGNDRGRLGDAWRVILRRPLVLEAALAKLPVMLASGGAWILLHGVADQLGEVALALGALHSARAIGTGVGPLVWA